MWSGPRNISTALMRSWESRSDTFVIDEPFFEYAREKDMANFYKVNLIPDVGELHGNESSSNAKAMLGILDDSFVILVYGSLTKKKGI